MTTRVPTGDPTYSPSARRRFVLVAVVALAAVPLGGIPNEGVARVAIDAGCALPPQEAPLVPRPTFDAPVDVFRGEEVVVHYATDGADAPQAGGRGADGVPLYVKLAAAAADYALAYYTLPHDRPGLPPTPAFPVRPCDRGGVDSRIDIYLKGNLGAFGVAYPPTRAEGGNFVVLDTHLPLSDPGDANFDRNGVVFTVLHEMFHLVQFAYVPSGMPAWVAEGTANAMALDAEAKIVGTSHTLLYRQLDAWRSTPWRPMYDDSLNQARSYGGVAWWFAFASHLPAYFEKLRAVALRGAPVGFGLDPLRQTFTERCALIVAGCPLGFPLALDVALLTYGLTEYVDGSALPRLRQMKPRFSIRVSAPATYTRTLAPMALHFIELVVPRGIRRVEVVASGSPRHPEVAVALGITGARARFVYGANTTAPIPRRYGLPRSLRFDVRTQSERRRSILVLSNAAGRAVTYRLRLRAR